MNKTIADFQRLMACTYLTRDKSRGLKWATHRLKEEIEELETSMRNGKKEEISMEIADVFAWLTSVSNLVGVDLELASYSKYGAGCSKCNCIPCKCPKEKDVASSDP